MLLLRIFCQPMLLVNCFPIYGRRYFTLQLPCEARIVTLRPHTEWYWTDNFFTFHCHGSALSEPLKFSKNKAQSPDMYLPLCDCVSVHTFFTCPASIFPFIRAMIPGIGVRCKFLISLWGHFNCDDLKFNSLSKNCSLFWSFSSIIRFSTCQYVKPR